MEEINGMPFFEVEFSKDGTLHTPAALDETAKFMQEKGISDLMVFSHGWNNDKADARKLYTDFLESVAAVMLNQTELEDRRFAFLGIYWPSKKFTDRELIPGGAASVGDRESDDDLIQLLESLKSEPELLGKEEPVDAVMAAAIDRAMALVPELEVEPDARREFIDEIRSILPRNEAHADDGSDQFFARTAEELFGEAAEPVLSSDEDAGDIGGVAGGIGGFAGFDDEGGAAGFFGDVFGGVTAAARRLVNFTTYYRMKARAGRVGTNGLAPAIAKIHEAAPEARLHLIGHSFGGRVVTAAAKALPAGTSVDSVSLLQAAFSHNAFASKFNGKDDGFFRSVVADRKVKGPIIITHTKNDKAVGIAYPLASRIAGQNAAGLGDREDPYGGLGRNGAVSTPEARDETLQDSHFNYVLAQGGLHNLKADRFISDHGSVTGRQVAHAVLAATKAAI